MASLPQSDLDKLISQLHRHEGTRRNRSSDHVAYLDTAKPPVLTIGYGHNCKVSPVPGVSKPGDTISHEKALELFESDLAKHIWQVREALPWIDTLDPVRQCVLYNMGFNLGISGLISFRNTLQFIQNGNFSQAANNMLASTWRKQVKSRAVELARQMETGEWQ